MTTTTAERPLDLPGPAFGAGRRRVASSARGRTTVFLIDAVFYSAVTVFVTSLVAYFLLD